MNEAVGDGLIEPLALLLGEFDRRVDFNQKIGHACHGVFHFFAGNADARALGGQFVFAALDENS